MEEDVAEVLDARNRNALCALQKNMIVCTSEQVPALATPVSPRAGIRITRKIREERGVVSGVLAYTRDTVELLGPKSDGITSR